MGLIKLAMDQDKLQKIKKIALNSLVLTGVGTGLYGDALMLKKMLKK